MAEARRLVTTGPYGIIRHPLYVMEELAAFAVLITVCLFQHSAHIPRPCLNTISAHEKRRSSSGKAFPEYQAYKLSTARLIPRVY